MIDTEQWRRRIGCFTQPAGHRRLISIKHGTSLKASALIDLNYRLFITALCAWAFLIGTAGIQKIHEWNVSCENVRFMPESVSRSCPVQVTCMYTFLPHVNTIILANDVESNPGPTDKEFNSAMEKILGEMKNLRQDMNTNFESISSDLREVKKDVCQVKEEMQQIKDNQNIIKADVEALALNVENVEDKVLSLGEEVEKLEQYSRRDNIILYGLQEAENETAITSTERVLKLLNDYANTKDWTNRDIVRAHRLGKKTIGRTRPMIVRLQFYADKFEIFSAREALKAQSISIANDLTTLQREQLRKLREGGKRGYFRNGKLIVDETSRGPAIDHSASTEATNNVPGNTGHHNRSTPPKDKTKGQHRTRSFSPTNKTMTTRSKQYGKRDSNK